MYSCIIVDDEPLAHTVLLSYMQRANLKVMKQCYHAEEARLYLSANAVDILFLDIEMPEETGLHLLKSLPQKPVTIFTTAFLHYSLDAFDLGVIDYLVKPIRYGRFEQAVNKATEFLQLLQLRSDVAADKSEDGNLQIKTGNKRIAVNRSRISHVQALKDYVIIFSDDAKYVARSTMKEMEYLLGINGFIRVHKSFIISKRMVVFYNAGKIEFDSLEIPVGRKYKKGIEEYLNRM